MQRLFFAFILFLGPLSGALSTDSVTLFFSPEDHLEKRLIDLIEREKRSIHVCVYALTHREVIAALIAAKKRGVDVEVVVDRFSVKASSPLRKLAEAFIPVAVWDPDRHKKSKTHRPLMHNKFCIFGNHTVWTGSFNFTYEASTIHQENVVVIQDESIAHAYQNQFETIKIRSCIQLGSFITSQSRRHKR